MVSRKPFAFDWILFLLTLALLGLGLLMVASATASASRAGVALRDLPIFRQSINAVIALAALVVTSLISYRFWGLWQWALYGAMLAGLLAVLVAGRILFGAQSWFEMGSRGLQPSELAKIILIIVLARYFADHEAQVRKGTGIIISLLITVPFLALIFAQPDMGTAAVLAAIWLGMLFVAGLQPKHLPLFLLAAIILTPLLWNLMQQWPHMQERILTFLQPNSDLSGKGYNVDQALISIGSGGLWGKGLGQGSQSQLGFLIVRHTDFVFSVLAEELGFVGSMLLLVLLASLLLRIIRIGGRADDSYGRLVASGVAIMILVQVGINIGFNVGLVPVTGLPLPLISYGGSSLIATLIGLGLVQSIAIYRQPPEEI
jgi:rod shape determining protein RodA